MKTPHRVAATSLLVLFALSACSSGSSGSSNASGDRTTTSSRVKGHRPRPSTTSTTAAAPSSTSRSSTTTAGTTPPDTAPPTASGPGCGTRAGPIFAAVQGGDLATVPLSSYTITDCRISDSDPIWSAVTLTPNPGTGVVRLTVVLQRLGSIWTVNAYGPGPVGCDIPVPARGELRVGC